MQIYIHKEERDFGPYSPEAVREYIAQGVFHASDYGWHDGLPEWKPVGELVGLGAHSEPAPIPPARAEPVPAPSAFTPSGGRLKIPAEVSPGRTQALASFQKQTRRIGAAAPVKPKRSGAMIAFNLVLVIAAVCAADVRLGNGGPMARHYFAMITAALHGWGQPAAAEAPKAEPAPVGTPAPVAKAAPPEPLPEPAATPAAPKSFDVAELAANPAAWPKVVMLKAPSIFPAVYNAQVVGKVTVPQGTLVHLVGIKGGDVELEYNGGGARLPWKSTDLEQRAKQQ